MQATGLKLVNRKTSSPEESGKWPQTRRHGQVRLGKGLLTCSIEGSFLRQRFISEIDVEQARTGATAEA